MSAARFHERAIGVTVAIASLLVAAAITLTILFAVAISSPLPPGFFALGFLAALTWTGR